MSVFMHLVARDLRLAAGRGFSGLSALAFFIVTVSLFPLAMGASPEVLRPAARGIVWVAALLAALLPLESLWHRDDDDGTFDMLLLSDVPAFVVIVAKMTAHWLVCGLPLVLLSPVAAAMLQSKEGFVLALSLCIGTLYISLVGGFGAVLTFGAKRPGILLTLLVLPLLTPMLIFGALAAAPFDAYVLLQMALLCAALPFAPLAAAKVLRLHVRSL